MCYQRCESAADGVGLATECRGHCGRSVIAQREKRVEMNGDSDREGHHISHLSLGFFFIDR